MTSRGETARARPAYDAGAAGAGHDLRGRAARRPAERGRRWSRPTVKAEFIRRLLAAGLPVVEATSFVHPTWVPQLADAEDLLT